MKFNLLNYLLETVSMVLTLAVRSYLVGLLQILVTSCGTPIVYYLGMEDNRQDADTIINIIYINKHISNCKERKPGPGVRQVPCQDVQEEEQPGGSSTSSA